MGFRLPLEQTERVARDSKDQLRRAEFYERTYRQTLSSIQAVIAYTEGNGALASLEEIDGIVQRALGARW